MSVAMNHPIDEAPAASDGPEWLRTLKGCAILSKPVKAPVRLIMWTLDDDRDIAQTMPKLLELKPDVIVFNGSAKEVHISLYPDQDQVRFDVFTRDKNKKEQLHCQGRINTTAPDPIPGYDIGALEKQFKPLHGSNLIEVKKIKKIYLR